MIKVIRSLEWEPGYHVVCVRSRDRVRIVRASRHTIGVVLFTIVVICYCRAATVGAGDRWSGLVSVTGSTNWICYDATGGRRLKGRVGEPGIIRCNILDIGPRI